MDCFLLQVHLSLMGCEVDERAGYEEKEIVRGGGVKKNNVEYLFFIHILVNLSALHLVMQRFFDFFYKLNSFFYYLNELQIFMNDKYWWF